MVKSCVRIINSASVMKSIENTNTGLGYYHRSSTEISMGYPDRFLICGFILHDLSSWTVVVLYMLCWIAPVGACDGANDKPGA